MSKQLDCPCMERPQRTELKTHRAREQVDDETVKVDEPRAAYWIDCALNICRKQTQGHVSERVSLCHQPIYCSLGTQAVAT